MRTRVETKGMDELLVILSSAQRAAIREAKQIVSTGSLNIKQDWARAWGDLDRLRLVPPSIGYDLHTVGTEIYGEIGPQLDSAQGGLAHVLEEGTINNPAQPGGLPALDKEEPKFIAQVEKLAADLLEGRRT